MTHANGLNVKQKRMLGKRVRQSIPGWLFVLPMLFGICCFTIYPIIQSFYYSFYEYDVVSVFRFRGLANYADVFTDSEMRTAMTNTFIFAAINIPVVLVGSYLLSLLLNTNLKGIKAFRILFYLPCVIPAIAGGVMWSYLMRYNVETPGLLNRMLTAVGLPMSKFFYAEDWTAIGSIVFMNLWSLGGGTVIWLAQFKNIPQQLYEAAKIDGAGKVRQFFTITLPLSTPMLFYNIITQLIMTLQFNGTLAFAPRDGRGMENATYMYGLKIYYEAFRRYNMGYASAMAWVLVAMMSVLTGVMFKTNKWVQYNEG